MQELLNKIAAAELIFRENATQLTNKSAQGRARKASLELRELYKEFRVKSVEISS